MAKKNTANTADAAKKKLADELTALLPRLDEEGLDFLISQAHVLIHNMEVDRINAEIEKNEKELEKSSKARTSSAGKSRGKSGAGSFSIKHSAGAGCYHVGFHGDWKLFTEDEMLSIVRIAKSRQPAADVERQCFAWLKKERSDALVEFGISTPDSENLKEFIKFLKKTFAIRK